MKFNNSKLCKHILTFALLLVFGLLAAGSSSAKKGIKYYKNGEYEKALKELEGTTTDGSGDYVDEFYFLGKTYQQLGRTSDSENALVKAWNLCVDSNSKKSEFQKKYPSEYNSLVSYIDNLQKSRARTANVGTWTLYQIQDTLNKKVLSSSVFSSAMTPKKQITLNTDGSISPYPIKNYPVKWEYDEDSGFYITTLNGENKGGLNSQGYLTMNLLSVSVNGTPVYVTLFYTKD